jgi:hypothetical protein
MTHVWLLPPGERRGLSLLSRWLARFFPPPPALEGPSEDDALARELGRLLGPAYACTAVESAAAAARRIGRNERVILVPAPDGSSDRIEDAARELGPIRVQLATAPSPLAEPEMIEALAETIREGVIALAGADYAVVFLTEPGAAPIVHQLVEATRLSRPWRLARAAPHPLGGWLLRASLFRLGAPVVLAVPIPATRDVDRAMRELAPRVVEAPRLGKRPTYVRALLALVHRAEREAGWSSS